MNLHTSDSPTDTLFFTKSDEITKHDVQRLFSAYVNHDKVPIP